ncbi:uncharacterized protein LOC130137619 [Syzygium oleosum]|uniref:uncharacterized protein LOC130137619 n=1 Tax=Syzygium oleosum TaxID=219896 RepID=UPI0024B8A8A7|nr:uncharacterized protein LOC130137619 [Syzygium oleosum]
MDVKSCAKFVLLMLVATIALQASLTEGKRFKSDLCKVQCLAECSVIPNKRACYLACYKNCIGASEAVTFESQCNLDCMVSTCLELHPDAKKVDGCVNSCSENCKKS